MISKKLKLGMGLSAITMTVGAVIGATSVNAAPLPNLSPGEVIGVLKSASGPNQVISSSVRLDEINGSALDLQSVRHLGDYDGSRFWIAQDTKKNICVVVDLDGEVSASACHSANGIEKEGLSFGLAGSEIDPERKQIAVVLLPDSIDSTQRSANGGNWARVSDNLVVAQQDSLREGAKYSFERKSTSSSEAITVKG